MTEFERGTVLEEGIGALARRALAADRVFTHIRGQLGAMGVEDELKEDIETLADLIDDMGIEARKARAAYYEKAA